MRTIITIVTFVAFMVGCSAVTTNTTSTTPSKSVFGPDAYPAIPNEPDAPTTSTETPLVSESGPDTTSPTVYRVELVCDFWGNNMRNLGEGKGWGIIHWTRSATKGSVGSIFSPRYCQDVTQVELELFRLGDRDSLSDLLIELSKEGVQLATSHELLSLAVEHPEFHRYVILAVASSTVPIERYSAALPRIALLGRNEIMLWAGRERLSIADVDYALVVRK